MLAQKQWAQLALIASAVAGLSYFATWQFDLNVSAGFVWKGSGVALLAAYAALLAKTADGWLIAAVMACGAIGDVVLDAASLAAGAGAFAIGHSIALYLYIRNTRAATSFSQRLLAVLVVPFSVGTAFMLTNDILIALYTVFVSAMAALAWVSRFPRYRTGLGAMMFVASDLLIFAQMAQLEGQDWVRYAIWGLYYGGQLLIVVGVTQTLRAAADTHILVAGKSPLA